MKKVGILTFIQPQNKNYGAVLQAYALSKIVQQLGYDVELIDIRSIRNKATFFASFKQGVKETIEGNTFRDFLKNQVPILQPLYSLVELTEKAKEYDAVIVGSDQVWRPEYCGNLALHYFLDFVPGNVKRIAYAVSFGLDKWMENEATTAEIIAQVHKFKTVSVREMSGLNICKNTFGIDATQALDPTLLLHKNLFLNLLSQHKTNEKYIASFILDRKEETLAIESYVSDKTKLSVKSLNKREIKFLGLKWTKWLTVKEWLMTLKDSEMVITDSFHGVCFSLIFQKKFVCIGNISRGLARFTSVLQAVGLENRIFLNLEQVKQTNSWEADIDYDKVNEHLEIQKQISLQVLKNGLAV
jgi:hypothetical protein